MRALIAMSGGVDSSVAAWLLKEQGYDCTGATMKLYSEDSSCCSIDDVRDARSVAAKIGIPFYVLNFKETFEKQVINHFVNSYKRGLTPNPCIDCNKHVKFNNLLLRAENLEFDYMATGHYARIKWDELSKRYLLLKGADTSKDQSYVLYSLSQEQLSHTLFPLGDLDKVQVRDKAGGLGFLNAKKPDSQDICFVPDGDYPRFIEERTQDPIKEGDIEDVNGRVIGRHKGIVHYTVGQRRGLNIAAPSPLYVKSIDCERNIIVAAGEEALYSKTVTVTNINLIALNRIEGNLKVKAKLRYHHKEEPALVRQIADDTLLLEFDNPQRAVARGQAAVLYDDDMVVGGGTIS